MHLLSCEQLTGLMVPKSPNPISWMVQLGAWWSTSPLGYVQNFQFVGKHHRIDSVIVHPCAELATNIWHPTLFKLWCLPPTPSCISRMITKILSTCKHWPKIWSSLCLYNFPSMMVKGNAFNTNFFHCSMEYPFGKFLVEMYVYISCSHSSWNTNIMHQ